jgi:hypothetical protein
VNKLFEVSLSVKALHTQNIVIIRLKQILPMKLLKARSRKLILMTNSLPTCLIVLCLSMETIPTFNSQPEEVEVSVLQTSQEESFDLLNSHNQSRSFSVELGQVGLTEEQKSCMSKLYREGLKLEKSISHIGFLKSCLKSNLVPKGLSFHSDDFEKDVGLKMK